MKNSVKGILIAAALIIFIAILLKTCGGDEKTVEANNESVTEQTDNNFFSTEQPEAAQPKANNAPKVSSNDVSPEAPKTKDKTLPKVYELPPEPVYRYVQPPKEEINAIYESLRTFPENMENMEDRAEWSENKYKEIEELVANGKLHPEGATQIHMNIMMRFMKSDPKILGRKVRELQERYRGMSPLEIIEYR